MNKKILSAIQHRSECNIGKLTSKYIQSKPEDRESFMAGIEIERDLAQACQFCLEWVIFGVSRARNRSRIHGI